MRAVAPGSIIPACRQALSPGGLAPEKHLWYNYLHLCITVGIIIMPRPGTKWQAADVAAAASVAARDGGWIRTSRAIQAGIHPAKLYSMVEAGVLVRIERGLYRLAGEPLLSHPDLAVVGARVRQGVICLISALAFHELTTQIPHEVHLALPRGTEEPRLAYPPLKTYRFGGKAFSAGVETHELDGVGVRVYSPEKTLADCFKFRRTIGLDTALEAVRFYREQRTLKVDDLMRYAAICRVKNVMRPYLEALL